MNKIYALSDIHGNYDALKKVLSLCDFNKEQDILISCGDEIDRGPKSYEVIEELLSIPKLIAIRGNHSDWMNEWLQCGKHPYKWSQGGLATYNSYKGSLNIDGEMFPEHVPITHHQFFKNQVNYHIDSNNRVFVHGGFNRHILISEQSPNVLLWDRDLFYSALSFEAMSKNGKFDGKFKNKDGFEEIFLGHTPVQMWNNDYPMRAMNIWNIDTGCGLVGGKLSIINVETKQVWQS